MADQKNSNVRPRKASSPKTASKKQEASKKLPEKRNWIREEVLSVGLFMLAVFFFVSITRFQGLPEDTMFIGLVGTYSLQGLQMIFGTAVLLVSFYFLFWSIHIAVLKRIWSTRMWGFTLLTITILIAVSMVDIPRGMTSWEAGKRGMGGGYVGGGMAFLFVQLVGRIGTSIFIVLFLILSIIMILEKPISEIASILWNTWCTGREKINQIMYYEEEHVSKPSKDLDEPVIINPISPLAFSEAAQIIEKPVMFTPVLVPELKGKDLEPKAKDRKVVFLSDADSLVKRSPSEYRNPPLDLLTAQSTERVVDKKNIKSSIAVLEDTFASFGVSVKVNEVSCGPSVTRYELSPAPGVKVSKIISLTDDLQLNLAAPGIRMEAPIPGKSAIGIEVPNSQISSVGLRNLLSSNTFKKLKSPLAVALGEDIAGNVVVTKLSDMPHLLIAGSTGSGKSVCLNSIIMSLLYNAGPDELKLVFIDPKMVELTVYNGIPHLMTPVVTDAKKAAVVLRWMTTEMEKRYKAFADAGVRDIYRYNQNVEEKMPFIVIVIDELADLMMVSPVEVEDSICRLAQMARAAGMHLIVATQRPSVDVVTGIIKANIPSRIAFAVSSQADSRTILDIGGAEKLLGKGDMLFFPIGAAKPYRVQGAFVSDRDIETIVSYIKEGVQSEDHSEQLKEIEATMETLDMDNGDELFWDAVKVFVESEKASVSFLQRRLRIGYSRAARLVDLMEERGFVSEIDANKKRRVLINRDEMEKLYPDNKL